MSEKEKEDSDSLKERVLKVKKKLPHGIVSIMANKYPEYNTYKKRSRITNVLQLRIADQTITERLEELAEILKPEM